MFRYNMCIIHPAFEIFEIINFFVVIVALFRSTNYST